VKTEGLTDIADHTGSKPISNYNLKTLMLWACELKPTSWWTDDLNVIKICVVLLHSLADCLKNNSCPHYFVENCNILDTDSGVEIITNQLLSITESSLSKWFVDNYLRKCAQLCPDSVSAMFDDVGTKLQTALLAVIDWRRSSALVDAWNVCVSAEFSIACYLHENPLSAWSCHYLMTELANIGSSLLEYFTAVAFLRVAYEATTSGLNDTLLDALVTILRQPVGKRRCSSQFCSVLSLRQATKLMKVVVNSSRSTVQLIEIELSKAYLYRALRCKDSDSDSIYCLANVYLAVLYYITGQYQTAIDHCTLVTRSQDHSQCSSHVVQGELLPKIDDDIDTVLGLSVFYQYVRTAALNQQQPTQHVSVFTTELFAHYLHMVVVCTCLSLTQSRHFPQTTLANDLDRHVKSMLKSREPFIADLLLIQSGRTLLKQTFAYKPLKCQISAIGVQELNTSELVQLLQQSAVEHLTAYRQLQASKFGPEVAIVTTDFEALYAYRRGDYQQSLQFSIRNVRTLVDADNLSLITIFPAFLQLMDDEIVSLIAMALIVNPKCRNRASTSAITQLTLSLYLMTQCQLKLRRSLSQTLDYVEFAQRKHPVDSTLDQLMLKLTKRKILIRLASVD